MNTEMKKIYIVASYTNTMPGKLIRIRAAMKFWNRYEGDEYSHVSLSLTDKLDEMMSFARKKVSNPFISGIVKEDIRKGMFVINYRKSKIAVMEIEVTGQQYAEIENLMNDYWSRKEKLHFNYLGLLTMLIWARGVKSDTNFFCSQWVATVLEKCGIHFFTAKKPHDVRPFDFYCALKQFIVYEGLATEYPLYKS